MITATNNPMPSGPDASPTKLDKGGYEGNAETLDNKIDEILAEALLKIDIKLVDAEFKGSVKPTDTPTGTGKAFWVATQAGPYPNHGGFTVNANSFAVFSRDGAGAFSISQTALDLTAYQKIVDGNKINFWAAEAYPIGTQRNHLGKDWYNTSATAIGEIPGTSTKWVERLNYVSKSDLESIENILTDGAMNDVTKFTVTNYTSSQVGSDIKVLATATVSTKSINPTQQIAVLGNENYYALFDITNNSSSALSYFTLISYGASIAFKSVNFSVPIGRNTFLIQIPRGAYTFTGNCFFYLNTTQNIAIDCTVHSTMLINLNNATINENEIKELYNVNGYFNKLLFSKISTDSVNGVLKTEYEIFKTQVESDILELQNTSIETTVFNNICSIGGMTTLTGWSGTNASLVAGGIRVFGTSTLLSSSIQFNVLASDEITMLMDVTNNGTVSETINLSLFNGVYTHKSNDFSVPVGQSIIPIQMTHTTSVDKSVNIYINSIGATDNLTIRTILLVKNSDATTVKNLHNALGYFSSKSITNLASEALNGVDPLVIEQIQIDITNLQRPQSNVLIAEATGTSTATEELNGTFRGTVANINAIQRAINSIPDDTTEQWEIRCNGVFSTTGFADMSATDKYARSYKAFISLTGKRNIKIVGVNSNKKTVISCILPNTGSSSYQYFQNITMDCIDCELENLQIIGQNLRYPVHTESQLNIGSTMKFTNVHFWHKGNTSDALTQWASLLSHGIGISYGMKCIYNGCRFTSVNNAGFGGHDQYNNENSVMELNNCTFDATTTEESGNALSFSLFGYNTVSSWRFILNGNNFNNAKKLNLQSGANNNGTVFYANVQGHGNSKLLFTTNHTDNPYPELSDVLTYYINKTGATIPQYSLVNSNGILTTGKVFAICIDTPLAAGTFRAIKNTYLELSKIQIKAGETIVNGNYVSAENGKLIYSATETNAKIISIGGVLCLDF